MVTRWSWCNIRTISAHEQHCLTKTRITMVTLVTFRWPDDEVPRRHSSTARSTLCLEPPSRSPYVGSQWGRPSATSKVLRTAGQFCRGAGDLDVEASWEAEDSGRALVDALERTHHPARRVSASARRDLRSGPAVGEPPTAGSLLAAMKAVASLPTWWPPLATYGQTCRPATLVPMTRALHGP